MDSIKRSAGRRSRTYDVGKSSVMEVLYSRILPRRGSYCVS